MYREFYDTRHANQYLANSHVMYGDRMVLINNVMESGKVVCIDRETTFETVLDDPLWRYEFPELGFINLHGRVVQVSRKPRRMWKVGLCPRNIEVRKVPGFGPAAHTGILMSDALKACLNNDYPSVPEALRNLCLPNVVAISRRVALSADGSIYYKFVDQAVGSWSVDDWGDMSVTMYHEYTFLREAIREDMR